MAYNDSIKLEAENLFHRGHNLNQIVEILKKKHPKISYTTVEKWANTQDKKGKIWEDYKKEIIVQAREISHKSLANKYAEMKQKAEIIKEGLEQTLLSGNLQIKSIEGAIYAWKGLSEFIILIEEKYESKRTPKEIVLEFLDILNSVPQIKDVLKKHWNLVEDELKRRLENEWGKNV
jgi:hypothetical protein